jgi:hypothetical protein
VVVRIVPLSMVSPRGSFHLSQSPANGVRSEIQVRPLKVSHLPLPCSGLEQKLSRPLALWQQLLVVHSAKVQEASDAHVEVADRPVRATLPLLDHPILQVLPGDLRWEAPLDRVKELPRHLFVVRDGVGVQRQTVFLESGLLVMDKRGSKLL